MWSFFLLIAHIKSVKISKSTGKKMAGKLTKEKLTELKQAFKDFDKDGSGTISAEEFRSFMKKQAHEHDENISDIEIDIQAFPRFRLP